MGKNNAYLNGAAGEIFGSETITMYSSAVTADTSAFETDASDTEPAGSDPSDQSGGCGSAVGALLSAFLVIPISFIIKKRTYKGE